MAKLNVFISWSGEGSKQAAQALHKWLPKVLQNIDPFLSCEDIEKGTFWQTRLTGELQSKVGIICLTRDNLGEPWIHFEAGALSKALAQNRVMPILFGIDPSDVRPPLSLFQLTQAANVDDFKKVITSLNKILDESRDGIGEAHLAEAFSTWWPVLAADIKAIADALPKKATAAEPSPQDVMLKEILDHARALTRIVSAQGPGLSAKADPSALPANTPEPASPEKGKDAGAA